MIKTKSECPGSRIIELTLEFTLNFDQYLRHIERMYNLQQYTL